MTEPSSNPMDAIIVRFKQEARERVTTISDMVDVVDAADSLAVATEAIGVVREEAHKLKGASGMLDFPEIKDAATVIENLAALGVDAVDLDAVSGLLDVAVEALGAAVDLSM